MVQYIEVPSECVRPEVRAAAEKGVEYAKQHLELSDIGIRWFHEAPPDAESAWFQRPEHILGTINQEQLDHIRLYARLGQSVAGETAAHESFHIWSALDRQAKGMPMLSDHDADEDARATAFVRRYRDEHEFK